MPCSYAYDRQAICMFRNFSLAWAPIDTSFGTRSTTSIAKAEAVHLVVDCQFHGCVDVASLLVAAHVKVLLWLVLR